MVSSRHQEKKKKKKKGFRAQVVTVKMKNKGKN